MSGILKVGGSELINDNGGSGALQWGSGVPAGSVIQVATDVVTETNSITTSYVNYYEVSITLKSSSSDIIFIFSYDYHTTADNEGHGLKVYRGNSATVSTSDSLIYDKSVSDTSGPLIGYGPLGNHYLRQNFNFKDSLSGFSVGNILYYGFFFRKRVSNATVEIPTNQGQDGSFHTVLMEVQK